MPRDAFVLKIQRELCHPKYARKVSGLSRNRPLALVNVPWEMKSCIESYLTTQSNYCYGWGAGPIHSHNLQEQEHQKYLSPTCLDQPHKLAFWVCHQAYQDPVVNTSLPRYKILIK